MSWFSKVEPSVTAAAHEAEAANEDRWAATYMQAARDAENRGDQKAADKYWAQEEGARNSAASFRGRR